MSLSLWMYFWNSSDWVPPAPPPSGTPGYGAWQGAVLKGAALGVLMLLLC